MVERGVNPYESGGREERGAWGYGADTSFEPSGLSLGAPTRASSEQRQPTEKQQASPVPSCSSLKRFLGGFPIAGKVSACNFNRTQPLESTDSIDNWSTGRSWN